MPDDNPHDLDEFELSHRADALESNGQFGPESVVSTAHNGFQMRMAAHPAEVDYVRVCDPDGLEIAYWSIDEIREDPADVLGAIMGALVRRSA